MSGSRSLLHPAPEAVDFSESSGNAWAYRKSAEKEPDGQVAGARRVESVVRDYRDLAGRRVVFYIHGVS